MRLADLPVGGAGVLLPSGVLVETDSLTSRRLLHQGLVAGAVVGVVRVTSGGGRIVSVGHSRVALDPAVTAVLQVETEVGQRSVS